MKKKTHGLSWIGNREKGAFLYAAGCFVADNRTYESYSNEYLHDGVFADAYSEEYLQAIRLITWYMDLLQ